MFCFLPCPHKRAQARPVPWQTLNGARAGHRREELAGLSSGSERCRGQLLENRPFLCTSPRTKSFSLPILRLEIAFLRVTKCRTLKNATALF